MDDEIDTELVALQSMIEGGQVVSFALALALIDAGLIDKNRLIDILESLLTLLAADFSGRLGSIDDAQVALTYVRERLDGSDWKEGQVLEHLRKLESIEFLGTLNRAPAAKRKRPPPPEESV